MAREFIVPGRIYSGSGALEAAGAKIAALGKKALIVTDETMVQLGNAAKLETVLQQNGVAYAIFDGVFGEASDVMVAAGLKAYRENDCDFMIALGGGSPLDTMKAIAAMLPEGISLTDYMGREIEVDRPPLVAIPTTAGTGSEATQFTIIADTVNNVKMLLKGACLIPDIAIVDPQFTMTAPPRVTANTGLDALCHAMEAYTSRRSQLMSDTFALSAVKRIFRYLPTAYHEGQNEEARIQMSVASLEAGIAFNNASVTIIHGMSRPIGALFHIAHGLSNAMLIKECMRFACDGAYDRFADLGRAIGAASDGDDDRTAAEKYLAALFRLVEEMNIPTLAEYGIDRQEFFDLIPKMAHDAMVSGSPQNTIRETTEADLIRLYERLWD